MYLKVASARTANELAESLSREVAGDSLSGVLLFAPISAPLEEVLRELGAKFPGVPLIGASSGGGQFCNHHFSENGLVAAAIIAEGDLVIEPFCLEDIGVDTDQKVKDSMSRFREESSRRSLQGLGHYALLLLQDAFALDGDSLVNVVKKYAGIHVVLAGGLAGDAWEFRRSLVFYNDRILSAALVGFVLYSQQKIGVGVCHGWQPMSDRYLVTSSKENILYELDETPALEVWRLELKKIGVEMPSSEPVRMLAKYELGMRTMGDEFLIRAPLAVRDDGGILFAGKVPVGRHVHIMQMSQESLIQGASDSVAEALQGVDKPGGAILFSCAARLATMGESYPLEVERISQTITAPFIGMNSYGEICRKRGEFIGFHNTTLVAMVLPRAESKR